MRTVSFQGETEMASFCFRRTTSVMMIAAALGACASTPAGIGRGPDTEVIAQPDAQGLDPIATAAFWGTRYDRNPMDIDVAVRFSKALRDVDNNAEALRVMQTASTRAGDHPGMLLELGKALIANERAHEAVRPIERSIALGKGDDWSALSTYGVALDMTGQHRAARTAYERALNLSPGNPKVLNNIGLSYALSGRHENAELALRDATNGGQGTARIRQNFALVLALGGKTNEAERLARSDLPPSVADGNVAYFQQLVAGPAYWGDLDAGNAELPDFGDDPESVSFATRQEPVAEPNPSPTPGLIKRNKPKKVDPNAPGVAPFSAPPVIEGTPAPGVGAKATDTDSTTKTVKADGNTATMIAEAIVSDPTPLEFKGN